MFTGVLFHNDKAFRIKKMLRDHKRSTQPTVDWDQRFGLPFGGMIKYKEFKKKKRKKITGNYYFSCLNLYQRKIPIKN